MREILFKAKRVDNGEWVEGTPYKFSNGDVYFNVYGGMNSLGEEYFRSIEVHPETVCQFWRRINGKPLFENDIFIANGIKRVCKFDKEFQNFSFANYDDLKDDSWRYINQVPNQEWFDKYCSDFEVIGNIHDEMEL